MVSGNNASIAHAAVCFSDKNGRYYKEALVTACSVFANASCPVRLHIVHDDTLTAEARAAFEALVDGGEAGHGVEFHHALPVPPDVRERNRLGAGAWYRLMLPSLVDADRVLYLDADVVCEYDVKELSRYDIGNYLLGVVPFGRKKLTELVAVMRLDKDRYFNDGVLLMNCKKIREERPSFMEDIFAIYLKCPPGQADQEAMNIYCNKDPEALFFLPEECNFRVWMGDHAVLPGGEYQGKIVHFSGHKGWQENTPAALLYWKYRERLFPGERVAEYLLTIPLHPDGYLFACLLRTRWLRSLARLWADVEAGGVWKAILRRAAIGSLKKKGRKKLRKDA